MWGLFTPACINLAVGLIELLVIVELNIRVGFDFKSAGTPAFGPRADYFKKRLRSKLCLVYAIFFSLTFATLSFGCLFPVWYSDTRAPDIKRSKVLEIASYLTAVLFFALAACLFFAVHRLKRLLKFYADSISANQSAFHREL